MVPMTRTPWKRTLPIVAICICTALLTWLALKALADSVFSSDESTALVTSVPMLDGRMRLGLYRQHMWDALLWSVVASPDSLPAIIRAPRGTPNTKLAIVTGDAQLGFQDPPLQLRAESRTSALLCGKQGCQTIQCDDATGTCHRIQAR